MKLTLEKVAGILEQLRNSKSSLIHVEYRDFEILVRSPSLPQRDGDAEDRPNASSGSDSSSGGIAK